MDNLFLLKINMLYLVFCDKRVGVRNGCGTATKWYNQLKWNNFLTIKKWYLFSDLGVVCTTNIKKRHLFRWCFFILFLGRRFEHGKKACLTRRRRRARERRSALADSRRSGADFSQKIKPISSPRPFT